MANASIEDEVFKLLLEELRASNEFGEEATSKISQLINDNLLTDTEAISNSIRGVHHETD